MKSRADVLKNCLRFVLFLSLVSLLQADFKIMIGANLSRYDVRPEEENVQWDYKAGFLGGIGFERKLSPYMLLEWDIFYFQKGSRSIPSDASNSEARYILNVLSLPLLFRSKFFYDSSPYVFAGVEFSSIFSHEIQQKGQEPVDLREKTRRMDFGFVFGCGYEIKIEDHLFFFVESRYHFGSRNIIASTLEAESKRTRALVILIGFRS